MRDCCKLVPSIELKDLIAVLRFTEASLPAHVLEQIQEQAQNRKRQLGQEQKIPTEKHRANQ